MTISAPHNQRRPVIGVDMAGGRDETLRTMYLPHPGRPGCGYTLVLDEQVDLFRLGLLPLRCKSCREMITEVKEGA
jgi:hypothetical protein